MRISGEEKKRSIAFIGTGLMGGPMARRLLGAGFSVTVWNRSADKAEALVADGAVLAASPAEAAKGADIVITMLSDGKAVGEVLTAEHVTDCNTFDQPDCVRPVPFKDAKIEKGVLRLTLPAKSIVTLELQ